MAEYTFSFYQFSDITAFSGNPKSTTETVGTTGSFAVNTGATPVTITVVDDDSVFDDGFTDPGTAQTLKTATLINGVTYAAGTVVELEFSIDTTSGATFAYIRINGVNVGIGGIALAEPGITYTISGSADAQAIPYDTLACFTRGTLIETEAGPRPIESLVPGDMIRTLDDGFQPLRWIGERRVSQAELRKNPDLAPVTFHAGAFGNSRDLVVSPQHRMLLSDWRAQLFFGHEHVLAPAKALVNGTSVRSVAPSGPVHYFHLLFDRHQVIYSEGALSESFHPGDQAVSGLHPAALIELMQLFPDLVASLDAYGPTVFPVLKAKQAEAIDWVTAA